MPLYPTTGNSEYYRDLYGGGEISWVPPIENYSYIENTPLRGIADTEFRWEEVVIPLENVLSGAMLDFVMPDQYIIQITPDIGWQDELTMLGEPDSTHINNPHLANIGPFSISAGTLEDNGDNSVTATISTGDLSAAIIDNYPKYIWRAVPWANGNPGLGGIPVEFEWVSTTPQLSFEVDPIKPEHLSATQKISGKKGSRVTITYEADDNPPITIEQGIDTWLITFPIDRPRVKFVIKATDSSGSAIANYQVDISYDSFTQLDGHVWNAFDSFALLASVDRLPEEGNRSLRTRMVDAFTRKGGTHYRGLVYGTNRSLGLMREDEALSFQLVTQHSLTPAESRVLIYSRHTRLEISTPDFIIEDEIRRIDPYYNTIITSKRIGSIIRIQKISGEDISVNDYKVSERLGYSEGKEIKMLIPYTGLLKVSYTYIEELSYAVYNKLDKLVNAINALRNVNGFSFIKARLGSKLSGSELSKNLYKDSFTMLASDYPEIKSIGWSRIGLFRVSDEDWKWSFADDRSLFFDSKYYEYVKELKSQTNVEWGFVVADQDYWDAVDAEWYGHDSLPVAFDIDLAHYVTTVPLKTVEHADPNKKKHVLKFDPYEAFRMNYHYASVKIINRGLQSKYFRSGVGYEKDCKVSITTTYISAAEGGQVNLNPVHYKTADAIDIDFSVALDIAITI
jgi:hypothetical protein